MNFSNKLIAITAVAFLMTSGALVADANIKVGLVNFKVTVEKSKIGKQEQEMYEGMRKQIETIVTEKQDEFQKLDKKLNDQDFRESQAADALKKLEDQRMNLAQELSEAQRQFLPALQQTNYKIIQKIAEAASKASEKVAKDKGLDLVLNDDNTFFHSPRLDITDDVVAEMDNNFKQELENAAKPAEKK